MAHIQVSEHVRLVVGAKGDRVKLRRDFIAMLGAAAAFRPRLALAQPAKIPTVGVLVVGAALA
jgi:hypothetical protein